MDNLAFILVGVMLCGMPVIAAALVALEDIARFLIAECIAFSSHSEDEQCGFQRAIASTAYAFGCERVVLQACPLVDAEALVGNIALRLRGG